MKKILIVFLFIAIPLLAKAQLTGSGTYADPWSGTLSGDATWSGTKYINGDIIVDNEKLTISAGAKIIFLSEGSDIIITSTGQLDIDGTAGNKIQFTADDDNDGNYGETGERWGHISFQSMGAAGNSLIDYCIIEFGYKDNGVASVESFGGGLYAGFNNLVVSNCEIRNNFARFGGGIFIKDLTSPFFSNNNIHNNISSQGGGGIYAHNNSGSLLVNNIISYNSCTGAGGGGGLFIGSNSSIQVYNSTITKNSTLYPSTGNNIMLLENTSVPKPGFSNSIVWGSDNSISYVRQSTSSSDFINCAIQGSMASNYTNCINLNSVNNNATGPNFAAIDGTNWSILPISPCVDIGVDHSADPNVPLTDFQGNSRIGQTDIGAYESQFFKWQGDDASNPTVWNVSANWNSNLVPSGTESIYIPTALTNYPVSSSSQNYTIGSGKSLIIAPGARATFGTLTNSGTLKLESDATNISSLIVNSFSGNDAVVEIYLTGGGTKTTYRWHYISTPTASLPVSTFSPGTTLDVAQWVENRPTLSLREGWVAYDGYIYSTGGMGGATFSALTPGKGYNFWDNLNNKFTFSGQLNTGNVAVSLGFSGNATLHGFNLLGNPFSSGLNWDDIINGVYFPYPANTSKSLYFTRNNVQCTYAGGVGIPGDVTGIIPPMQGFFTKTYAAGNTITLPAAARTQGNIHPRYKSATIIPLVRLQLDSDTIGDETVIRFSDAANADYDYDYDALKMFLDAEINSIYSSLNGKDYAINGQPFPVTSVEIPVIFNFTKDTVHTLSVTQLQGLDHYSVVLIDNLTSTQTDLKTTSDLTFSETAGTKTGRFILKVSYAKAAQSITFSGLPVKTYGDADFSAVASVNSGLPLTFASDNTSVASIVNGMIHITGAGTAGITASQAGDIDYNPAVAVTQTLTVNKADQTISFGTLPSKRVGDPDFAPVITVSSGLSASLSSDNNAVATIVNSMIHITGAGTAIITASQPGNTNYKSATAVLQTLTVSSATGIEIPDEAASTFNIYSSDNILNIETISDLWDGKSGSVKVIDLTGKPVYDLRNAELSKGSLIQIQTLRKGMYIVEIKSGVMRYVGKVVVR